MISPAQALVSRSRLPAWSAYSAKRASSAQAEMARHRGPLAWRPVGNLASATGVEEPTIVVAPRPLLRRGHQEVIMRQIVAVVLAAAFLIATPLPAAACGCSPVPGYDVGSRVRDAFDQAD